MKEQRIARSKSHGLSLTGSRLGPGWLQRPWMPASSNTALWIHTLTGQSTFLSQVIARA